MLVVYKPVASCLWKRCYSKTWRFNGRFKNLLKNLNPINVSNFIRLVKRSNYFKSIWSFVLQMVEFWLPSKSLLRDQLWSIRCLTNGWTGLGKFKWKQIKQNVEPKDSFIWYSLPLLNWKFAAMTCGSEIVGCTYEKLL